MHMRLETKKKKTKREIEEWTIMRLHLMAHILFYNKHRDSFEKVICSSSRNQNTHIQTRPKHFITSILLISHQPLHHPHYYSVHVRYRVQIVKPFPDQLHQRMWKNQLTNETNVCTAFNDRQRHLNIAITGINLTISRATLIWPNIQIIIDDNGSNELKPTESEYCKICYETNSVTSTFSESYYLISQIVHLIFGK